MQYSQRALHPTATCAPHPKHTSIACRIGTEHEKLAMKAGTMERAGYAEIQQLLNGLVTRYGWRPMMEGGAPHSCIANAVLLAVVAQCSPLAGTGLL